MKEKLLELAKVKGLVLAEDTAEKMVEFIFEGLDIVVAESENKIDDGLYMALKPMMMQAIEKLVDKIDGEEE
jgi:hypothetical protein